MEGAIMKRYRKFPALRFSYNTDDIRFRHGKTEPSACPSRHFTDPEIRVVELVGHWRVVLAGRAFIFSLSLPGWRPAGFCPTTCEPSDEQIGAKVLHQSDLSNRRCILHPARPTKFAPSFSLVDECAHRAPSAATYYCAAHVPRKLRLPRPREERSAAARGLRIWEGRLPCALSSASPVCRRDSPIPPATREDSIQVLVTWHRCGAVA